MCNILEFFSFQIIIIAIIILTSFTNATEPVDVNVEIYVGGTPIFDHSVCHDGLFREAIVHLPSLPDKEPPAKIPLVLNFHPMFLDDEKYMKQSNFHELGDEEGFAVAYPEGFAKGYNIFGRVWNAGGCCVSSLTDPIPDDIDFIRKLIDYIQTELPKKHNFEIDTEQIYAIGLSNGGFMTYRIACEMSDIIAAVVPIAGQMMNSADQSIPTIMNPDPYECKPTRPVPLMHIHSTGDPIVPMGKEDEKTGKKPSWFIGQSATQGFPTAFYSIDQWRQLNEVTEDDGFHGEEVYNDAKKEKWWWPFGGIDTICTAYGVNTNRTIQFCQIKKQGTEAHCWPGEKEGRKSKNCGNKFGNKHIWDFLKKYKLSSSASPIGGQSEEEE
mmetsp:Transcript_11334/g.12661  ORF Transcript_11334/g.12661 Transcript_11334/m.12661 type:complete len:383 (+) Transcript_11334:90-1238(+)